MPIEIFTDSLLTVLPWELWELRYTLLHSSSGINFCHSLLIRWKALGEVIASLQLWWIYCIKIQIYKVHTCRIPEAVCFEELLTEWNDFTNPYGWIFYYFRSMRNALHICVIIFISIGYNWNAHKTNGSYQRLPPSKGLLIFFFLNSPLTTF